MIDRMGRNIEYLRISVTQKCNMNCIYCKPVPDGANTCESLSVEDFRAVMKAMADAGITKVRLTGGEPLLRQDICEIVEAVSSTEGIEDISITTNGLKLSGLAGKLKKSGLQRVNLSLDSLDPERFCFMTGGGRLRNVLEGMEAALMAGLLPLKLNTVLIKGINDDEIDTFIEIARDKPVEVRFIELMPIGRFGEQNKDRIVYNSDIISSHPQLKPLVGKLSGPAVMYAIDGYKGSIGFISPMSHKFCNSCNRIRLTCDGKIKPCLGDNGESDLIPVLKNCPEQLAQFIRNEIFNKPEGHNFNAGFSSSRTMNKIGG